MNLKYAKRSEDTEQIAVIQWAGYNTARHPELKWLYHCPNGGSRNQVEAAKFKQMGVKAGVSDLCLPYPKGIYCGLFIEMKYGSNKKTADQRKFLEDMEKAGHFVVTCYSAEAAITVIKEYLSLPRNIQGEEYRQICEDVDIKQEKLVMGIPNNSTLTIKGVKCKDGGA